LRDYVDDIDAVPPERIELMLAQFDAIARYQPKFYDGCVTVFRAPRHPLICSYDPALGWSGLARAEQVRHISGAHRNLLGEPHVRALARALQDVLGGSPT
jgi:thioesterase domain-containing protein